MTEKSKTIVVVAGLGSYYIAGRKLYVQLCELHPEIEPILIDANKLREIAKINGIDEKLFSPDVRGYGFWQWKPLLVHHYLKEVGRGQVIYVDAGCDINPPSFMRLIDWFINSKFKLLLSTAGHNISNYTKPDVIKQLNKIGLDPDKTQMLQAGFICVKTDSNIKHVFNDAKDYILNGRQELFNDQISDISSLPNYFIDHRHDQSVLSLLILNSPYIDEVGVLPTTLTPPGNRNWCVHSPIIASRNLSSVNLYWPLTKYGSYSAFPKYLLLQINIMIYVTRLCGNSVFIMIFMNKIFRIQFMKYRKIVYMPNFDASQILRPQIWLFHSS